MAESKTTTAKKAPAKKPAVKKPAVAKAAPKVESKPESSVLMSDSRNNRMNVASSKVEEFKLKGYTVV